MKDAATSRRLPLLYVLSTGRSGSTLLEMLLASHPGLFTVGEVQLLAFDAADSEARCSCGAPFADCPLWGPLLPSLTGEMMGPLSLFRATRDAGKALRPGYITSMLVAFATGGVARGRRLQADIYSSASADAIAGAMERSGDRVPIDASKDPYRLWFLTLSSRFDVRVVWLVRDPRGIAHSFAKSDGSPARFGRVAFRWMVQQLVSGLVLRMGSTVPFVVVRYEDLTEDPDTELERIGHTLGIDTDGFDPSRVWEGTHHAVAGNPMRARREPIRPDTAWTDDAVGRQSLVWALAGAVARPFGYRWRDRKRT